MVLYVPIKGYNFKEAYTRHTDNYIICNFIYSFIYLFNHFHHIEWNTQQKSEAPI